MTALLSRPKMSIFIGHVYEKYGILCKKNAKNSPFLYEIYRIYGMFLVIFHIGLPFLYRLNVTLISSFFHPDSRESTATIRRYTSLSS